MLKLCVFLKKVCLRYENAISIPPSFKLHYFYYRFNLIMEIMIIALVKLKSDRKFIYVGLMEALDKMLVNPFKCFKRSVRSPIFNLFLLNDMYVYIHILMFFYFRW